MKKENGLAGGCRLILNLKELNAFLPYYHFKMETLETAITLVTPGSVMASVNLRDAYYSIPIAQKTPEIYKAMQIVSVHEFAK